jgi:hypothetical protein
MKITAIEFGHDRILSTRTMKVNRLQISAATPRGLKLGISRALMDDDPTEALAWHIAEAFAELKKHAANLPD